MKEVTKVTEMESEAGFCADLRGGEGVILTHPGHGGSLDRLGCIVQRWQSNLAGDLMPRRDLSD